MPPSAASPRQLKSVWTDPARPWAPTRSSTGQSPETADWRYLMIMPDGSLFGDSQGEGADNVGFCHGCHASVARNDYLFYVPEEVEMVSD